MACVRTINRFPFPYRLQRGSLAIRSVSAWRRCLTSVEFEAGNYLFASSRKEAFVSSRAGKGLFNRTYKEPPCLRTMLFLKRDRRVYASTKTSRADCVVVDMEDSVAMAEKSEARKFIRSALLSEELLRIHPGQGLCLRVNDLSLKHELDQDLDELLLPKVTMLCLPKVRTAADVLCFDELVSATERRNGLPYGQTSYLIVLETTDAFFNCLEIARASKRTVALVAGTQDFSAETMGEAVYDNGAMINLFARTVLAAKACSLQAITGPCMDIDNFSLAEEQCRRDNEMGFSGKVALTKNQAAVMQPHFSVSEDELRKAVERLNTPKKLCARERARYRDIVGKYERETKLDKALHRVEVTEEPWPVFITPKAWA